MIIQLYCDSTLLLVLLLPVTWIITPLVHRGFELLRKPCDFREENVFKPVSYVKFNEDFKKVVEIFVALLFLEL